MPIRKDIVWTVADDGSVTPTTPQDGGVQGEHHATRAVWQVGTGSVWENPNFTLYVECVDGAGNVDATEPLQVEGGQVSVLLPLAWTQYGGISTLRLVAEGADGTIAYMAEGAVRFTSRQNASQKVDGLMKGRLATMEKRIGDLAEGAEQAVDDAASAKVAAERAAASAAVSGEGAQRAADQAKAAVSGKVDKFDTDEYSCCLCDEDGNVIAAYDKNGKPLTKDPERDQQLQAIRNMIATLGKSKVTAFYTEEYAWCFCDEDGNVCVGQLPTGENVGFGSGGWEQALAEVWDAIDNLPSVGGTTGYFNYKRCGLPVLYLQEKEAGAHNAMIEAANPANNYEKLEKSFDYILKTAKDSVVSSGTCDLKFQGSSSLRNNYPKYNYTFEANKGLEFEAVRDDSGAKRVVAWPEDGERVITGFEKPWGDQRKYCLKANFIDPSGSRNVVSARLWASIVKSRSSSDVVDAADNRLLASPNCGAIDGFPVVVVLNNQFNGLYTFNIPKEDWMFNGVNDEGDIKYIVGGESNNMAAAGFAAPAEFPEGLAQNKTDFAIEYIPDEDDPVAKQVLIDSLNAAIGAVMDAKTQLKQNPDYDWEAAVSPYFDIDSAIDYYIFTCCISGRDNLRKNILYATYGSTEDGVPDKWFMSAYDLDTTFGSNPYGKGLYKVKTDYTQFKEAADRHNLFYIIYHYAHDKLMERYKELRSDILSDANVWYMFNNFVNAIPKAVYNADADRWASADIVRTMPGTTTANVENFMQYYRMHCALLDKEMEV